MNLPSWGTFLADSSSPALGVVVSMLNEERRFNNEKEELAT
jgi:hypothetical protein